MCFRVDLHFDFILMNVENSASHNCVVQNDKNGFRATSKAMGNSFLISTQNILNNFFSYEVISLKSNIGIQDNTKV